MPYSDNATVTDVSHLLARYRDMQRDINSWIFTAKLALVALLLAGGSALTLTGAVWARVTGTVVLGLTFAHMLELQHETLHSSAFRGRRRNVIAGVALGLPLLVSFSAYQVSHLRHHRDLGTPANQEFFDYGDQYGRQDGARWKPVGLWAYRLLMAAHYRQFVITSGRVVTGRAPAANESPLTQRRIRRDYLVILGTLLAAAVASALTGSLGVVWAWLLPMAVVGLPAHALIELPEHFRCDTDTPDVLQNTRTITSNRFMAWLANTNNFHMEHHLMPNLPFHRLAELHRDVAPKARFFHPSYTSFFRALVRGELRRVSGELRRVS